MKKFVIIAVVVLSLVFAVSCDADSVQKTSKGLRGMMDVNLADPEMKNNAVEYVKECATDLAGFSFADIKSTPTAEQIADFDQFIYIAALAVQDAEQKGQEGKVRAALAGTLCDNSLYDTEPGEGLGDLLRDIYSLLDAGNADEVVAKIQELLDSFGISSTGINVSQINKIAKIARALMPGVLGFDAVSRNIVLSQSCTVAQYLSYHMLISMLNHVVNFIVDGSGASAASILDSSDADQILTLIYAIQIINDVDFDFPAIVSGLID